jgi:hypothetical protein
MSQKNGDKARSHRRRNENLHKRERIRQLRKALQAGTGEKHPTKSTSKRSA